jgi:hypothetical protein
VRTFFFSCKRRKRSMSLALCIFVITIVQFAEYRDAFGTIGANFHDKPAGIRRSCEILVSDESNKTLPSQDVCRKITILTQTVVWHDYMVKTARLPDTIVGNRRQRVLGDKVSIYFGDNTGRPTEILHSIASFPV